MRRILFIAILFSLIAGCGGGGSGSGGDSTLSISGLWKGEARDTSTGSGLGSGQIFVEISFQQTGSKHTGILRLIGIPPGARLCSPGGINLSGDITASSVSIITSEGGSGTLFGNSKHLEGTIKTQHKGPNCSGTAIRELILDKA